VPLLRSSQETDMQQQAIEAGRQCAQAAGSRQQRQADSVCRQQTGRQETGKRHVSPQVEVARTVGRTGVGLDTFTVCGSATGTPGAGSGGGEGGEVVGTGCVANGTPGTGKTCSNTGGRGAGCPDGVGGRRGIR
jgi:hypothetical protein